MQPYHQNKSFSAPTFGSAINSRAFACGEHRFGFNKFEKDDEVKGNVNHISFGDYGYDPRIGRRWNIDPYWKDFTELSNYMAFGNNPVVFKDVDGEKIVIYYKEKKNILRLFEKKKAYEYVPQKASNYTGNSKFLIETIRALDYITEKTPNSLSSKVINSEDKIVKIDKIKFNDPFYPSYYTPNKDEIKIDILAAQTVLNNTVIITPVEILNHELGHAYIDLFMSEDEKNSLINNFNNLNKEDQKKWGNWEEKFIIETLESELGEIMHGENNQRKEYDYNGEYKTYKVNSSTSKPTKTQ
jgi:hypothetical protein